MRPQALSLALFAAVALPSAIARAQAPLPPTGTAGVGPGAAPGFGPGETARTTQTVEDDVIGVPRGIRTRARAPSLPDLVHDGADLSVEHTIASIAPTGAAAGNRLTSNLFHLDSEARILGRFYVGAALGLAAGREPRLDGSGQPVSEGTEVVPQQPLLFARIARGFVRDRYVVGAGLGVVPPLFTYGDQDDIARLESSSASTLASTVRPWDASTFLDRRVTLRPWIDLRAESRRFVVQFRQALDTSFRTGSAPCTSGDCASSSMGLLSISTLFLGWKPTREVALGLEAWEVYLLRSQLAVADRDRSAFALSPGVRFFYRWVEPSVSLLLPVGPPLLGAADSYFGLRVNVRVWLTPR